MELNTRQWYVRWFFWSVSVLDEFAGRYDTTWHYRNGTNLCQFIRIVLLWCPLALLLNIAVYAAGIVVLTALPIYFWGGTGYSYVVGAIAIVLGVIVGMKALFRAMREWRRQRPYTPAPARRREVELPRITRPAPTGPSFWQVLWQFLVATKQKVCPIITFSEEAQGAAQ